MTCRTQASPRRAHFTKAQRLEIAERDNWICQECGEPVEKNSAWQADHVVPVGLGGANTAENGQLLCWDCHSKKTHERDRPPMAKADRIRKKREGRRLSKRAAAIERMEEKRRAGRLVERQTIPGIDG